jgi:hypothetical protein
MNFNSIRVRRPGGWQMALSLCFLFQLVLAVSVRSQSVTDLVANYTGTATWNSGSSTMTFVTSGEIAFDSGFGRTADNASRWDVPSGVARITINSNVTVTGQFKFNNSGTYVVAGQHRYTSRLYGTPEQKFTQNRGLSAVDFSAIFTGNNTVTVSNLTSFDPKGYQVRGGSSGPVHMSNCDFLDTRGGRQNNSDGYVGGGGSVVQDCFFETGDDVIKVYWGTTTYRDNIIRMVPNTVPIQFGWGDYGSGAVGNFTNLIVLGSEGRGTERAIIDGETGNYTKTLNITGCDIQNLNSTLIRLGDPGQAVTVNITDAFIKVKKHSTVISGASLTANICGSTTPATNYDCRPTLPLLPLSPTGFAVAGTGSAIQLIWTDSSTNESMFRIERATSGSGPWEERGFLIRNKTAWTDSLVNTGTTYYYRMRAYNTTGFSAYTAVLSSTTALPPLSPTPPAPPTNLLATAVATNQIQLFWDDASNNEMAFEIQRATNTLGPWSVVAAVGSNVTAAVDSNLLSATTYYYAVRATNSAGVSAWSNTNSATTLTPPPPGGSSGYTNLDSMMSAAVWRPATNPAPPGADAVINFSSATNLTWVWDNAGGTNGTLTWTLTRSNTNGPGGGDVYFFGPAIYSGSVTDLRLAMDVEKAVPNIGTLRFALRQGTNLFHTSSALSGLPGSSGVIVNCDLTGLTTLTVKTNGVVAQTGLTWQPRYAGTVLNFANGQPLEFGFRNEGSMGATATSTSRGPILDNYLVEVSGSITVPPAPLLSLTPAGSNSWQLSWDAPGFVLQQTTNVAGPWSSLVPPATSPYIFYPTGAAGFYRLQWPAP